MSKNKNLEVKISKMPFEAAMVRLEEVVQVLSAEKISLDQMIELYEEGDLLKRAASGDKVAMQELRTDPKYNKKYGGMSETALQARADHR